MHGSGEKMHEFHRRVGIGKCLKFSYTYIKIAIEMLEKLMSRIENARMYCSTRGFAPRCCNTCTHFQCLTLTFQAFVYCTFSHCLLTHCASKCFNKYLLLKRINLLKAKNVMIKSEVVPNILARAGKMFRKIVNFSNDKLEHKSFIFSPVAPFLLEL